MPSKKTIASESEETDETLDEYKYTELATATSIRLLNLRPGSRNKLTEVVCELLEEDIDKSKERDFDKNKQKHPRERAENGLQKDDCQHTNENEKKYPVKDTGSALDGSKIVDPDKSKGGYEALSWAWGTEPWTHKIRIRVKGEDFLFRVPLSLLDALRALRDRKEARKLWIDAICIDQDNPDEKNRQIPMMAKIYGGARRVCIWLGQGDEESKKALTFINEEVLKLQGFDELCDDPEASRKWNAMLNLMKRSWFSRRWVVQEIALAKDAIVYCGKDSILWKDFADAIQLFVEVETATHRLSEVMKKDPTFYHVPGWFEYVSALGASLLVDATSTLFRVSNGEEQRPLLSLEHLVSNLSVFQVSEAPDCIYSLLAIAKDTQPVAVVQKRAQSSTKVNTVIAQLRAWASRHQSAKPYRVDYKQPFIDICKEFILFSIYQSDRTRALDIICRPWAPSLKKKKEEEDRTAEDTRRKSRQRWKGRR